MNLFCNTLKIPCCDVLHSSLCSSLSRCAICLGRGRCFGVGEWADRWPTPKSNHAICSGAKEKGCSLVLYVVAKGEKEGRDAHLTMGLENNSINCFVTFKFFSPFGLPKHVPPSLNQNPGLAPPLNRATF